MIGSAALAGYPENGSDEDPLLELKSVYLFFLLTVAYHLQGSLAGTLAGEFLALYEELGACVHRTSQGQNRSLGRCHRGPQKVGSGSKCNLDRTR